MIKPVLQDDAFLADVKSASLDEVHLWWLGQSGFLVRAYDRFLLIDPYLSDSLTKKYANTDKPHVRMSERVVDPARLDFIHVVTSSHAHTDHLDPETLQPLMRANTNLRLVAPEATRPIAAERAAVPPHRILPMVSRSTEHLWGIEIISVPAAHEKRVLDERGSDNTFLGYVFGCGDCTIYHSGDTIRCEDAVKQLRHYDIDIAILPINGRKPERRVDGNLWGAEAAQLAKDIDARLVIPCHYDLFEFNTANPMDEFVPTCEKIGQAYHVLKLGERFSSSQLPPW